MGAKLQILKASSETLTLEGVTDCETRNPSGRVAASCEAGLLP